MCYCLPGRRFDFQIFKLYYYITIPQLGPIKGNPGPQSNARGQQTLNNANNNFNKNKPEAFQELTKPAINQEFGASSPQFETIK